MQFASGFMSSFWGRFLLGAAIGTLTVTAMAASEEAHTQEDEHITSQKADITAAMDLEGRSDFNKALDEGRQPKAVLEFLGLKTGDAVLDVFSGGGYYAEIMRSAIGPYGSVVAHNPPRFFDGERADASWAGIIERTGPIEKMPADLGALDLGNARFDFVMMHLIYHDFYWESEQFAFERIEPRDALAKIFAATKPGGVVGLIDHIANPSEDVRATVDDLHRIDPEVARADFEAVGFVLEAEANMLRIKEDDHSLNVFDPAIRGKTDRFVMRFRKPK